MNIYSPAVPIDREPVYGRHNISLLEELEAFSGGRFYAVAKEKAKNTESKSASKKGR
jgi:hypothetical protein